MKRKTLMTILSLTLVLSSCLNIEETFEINEDESGRYTIHMDMSQMMAMAAMMGDASPKMPEKQDTLILFKDAVLKSKELSDEEKKIFINASLKIKMDSEAGDNFMEIHCPFSHISQLPYIKKNITKVMDKLKITEGLSKSNIPMDAVGGDELPDLNDLGRTSGSIDSFTAQPGIISLTRNAPPKTENAIAVDSASGINLAPMMDMLSSGNMSTVIKLAKPAIEATGQGIKISEDRKTVSFKSSMRELMENAATTGYRLTY